MGTNKNLFTVLKILAPMLAVAFIFGANVMERIYARDGSAELLAESDYLPKFVADIGGAKKSVICAMYMFKLDGFRKDDLTNPVSLIGAALADAVARGAEVSLILETGKPDEITTKYNAETSKILKDAGIKIYFDSPDRRLHTKMCVIDDNIVYLGSHNYTYSAMKRNSEVSVRIVSKKLAGDAGKYFSGLGL